MYKTNIEEKMVTAKVHCENLRAVEREFIESIFGSYHMAKIDIREIANQEYNDIELKRAFPILCEVGYEFGKFVVTHVCGLRLSPYTYSVWVRGHWENDYEENDFNIPDDNVALGDLYCIGLALANQME